MPATYTPPVDRLLMLGESAARAPEWPDYTSFGLGEEHVPDLIRMATDEDLHAADVPEAWAPLHAWRTLGQLRAATAVEPLTSLLHMVDEDDDWVLSELPRVFGMIGASAVPVLSQYLDRRAVGIYSRLAAAESLTHIGETNPDARTECAAALAEHLAHFATQDRTLNAFLIAGLADFRATKALPLIEQAFAADRVDLTFNGDWEDAQVEFGILPERQTPRPNYMMLEQEFPVTSAPTELPRPGTGRNVKDRAKSKRKMVKQSRRQNRRRK